MADQVTQILLNAQAPDPQVRNQAEQQLEAAKAHDFAQFMMTMCTQLATEGMPVQARMLAGLLMKNAISGKSAASIAENQTKWNNLDANTRGQVKSGCIQTLRSPVMEVRGQACQVISKVGVCELPRGEWLEVIDILKDFVIGGQDLNAKHGALVALGYICQEISEDGSECLEGKANDILTAVIQGMRKEETENEIRFVAVQALGNALEFANKNFENEEERNYIMQQLCECTQSPDKRVRKEAMDCLAQIAYYHYRHLVPYVQAISQITLTAIDKDEEEVATTAMEFWSTIVDEEISIQLQIDEEEEAAGAGDTEAQQNLAETRASLHGITKQATPFFVPKLLECLTRQKEDDDEESWTVSKAAAVCLSLFAQCAKDAVVDHVTPFLQANIASPDWKFQDSAILAFGSILEGPSQDKLKPMVSSATDGLLDIMVNPQMKVQVRDTTAWSIACILEYCPEGVPPHVLEKLIANLLQALKDEPRVAVHSCYAFQQLVTFVEDNLEDDDPHTTQLSPYSNPIFEGLITCANRDDADETCNGHELFTSAFTALGDLVRISGKDMMATLKAVAQQVLMKLSQSFQPPIVHDSNFRQSVQSQCCALINQLCNKLPEHELAPMANDMIRGCLQVFRTNNAEVHEEALMAISALALAMSAAFVPYMQDLNEPLLGALKNTDDHQVCIAAVGLVGDLSRALETNFAQFCEQIFVHLLQLLQNQHLQRDVKPPILSTFGDIALAIGKHFEKYMEHAMTMLFNASQLQADDPDDMEYIWKLQENILEGYSGITQALRDEDKKDPSAGGRYSQALGKYLPNIDFLLRERIVPQLRNQQIESDPEVLKAALNLLGDLAQALPAAKMHFRQQYVQELLQMGQNEQSIDNEDVMFASKILQ